MGPQGRYRREAKCVIVAMLDSTTGEIFDKNCRNVVLPQETLNTCLPAIWCFCSSPEYNEAVRRIDQKLNVTNATLGQGSLRLSNAGPKLPLNAILTDCPNLIPTIQPNGSFHGHPCGSVIWDEAHKVDHSRTAPHRFRPSCKSLSPACSATDGQQRTIRTWNSPTRLVSWVEQAMALHPFEDKDGIVCIPSVARERPAHERLLQLLHVSLGR